MAIMPKIVRIGGASGYWGDASHATTQLLASGDLDFIVYDYLAEITMAILARVRAKDPAQGYAADFVTSAMAPNLPEIARQGVRVISNAGGVNPQSCAKALRLEIAKQGLNLRVATVYGDDLMDQLSEISELTPFDMFSRARFPDQTKIASINAYLGAFPIAAALDAGADIVITGRCVDSAVTLAACISRFGWTPDHLNQLAGGSLAGHILECGTQATGGNFTDWQLVADGYADMGYPIAEIADDGTFRVTKPAGTGGIVTTGTVAEQMLYEIGDPQAYHLPDVVCDFSNVSLSLEAPDRVLVSGAKGYSSPTGYKTCLTYHDGWRGGQYFNFYGLESEAKATAFANAVFARTRAVFARSDMPDFSETSVELIGAETQFGAARTSGSAREIAAKIAVRHADPRGISIFLREATGLGLSAPPGLCGFAGTRPKPSPVMALFSFLIAKDYVNITVQDDRGPISFTPRISAVATPRPLRSTPPMRPRSVGPMVDVALIKLALARSGDKGNIANIGVIARRPEYLAWIWHALDEATLTGLFGHFLRGKIERFYLPGTSSMNIMLHQVLGGGGTSSLRNDPQGKGYSQLILAHKISVPESIARGLR